VWVHTCSLDHPTALPAYKARRVVEYRRTAVEIAPLLLPEAVRAGTNDINRRR